MTGKAELLLQNASIVDVLSGNVHTGCVLIQHGVITRVEEFINSGEAARVIDLDGRFLLPGLIDAHTHNEISLLSAAPFAKAVLRQGTTTAVFDPHDTVNVLGPPGAEALMRELKTTMLRGVWMAPPCVPSAPRFEDCGATVGLDEVKTMIDGLGMRGIAETMDYSRVLDGEEELAAILNWARNRGLMIDGHAPGLRGDELKRYFAAGPRTDHESLTVDEMAEKYALGMYVIIRRGSLSEEASVAGLLSRVSDSSRILLSTDGCIKLQDILDKGHMNYALRQLVAEGVDAIEAVKMATVNTARAYGLERIGAIAPGWTADLVVVEDLVHFRVCMVFAAGKDLDRNAPSGPAFEHDEALLHTIRRLPMRAEDFIPVPSLQNGRAAVRTLHLCAGTLETQERRMELEVRDGKLLLPEGKDVLFAATIDRYRPQGTHAAALVSGFGRLRGAFAGSIAQDTQNIVAVGDNENDIAIAVNELIARGGGIAVSGGGRLLEFLHLPIAGIMTSIPAEELAAKIAAITARLHDMGAVMEDPIFSISMQLPLAVIPELALTNRGLLDVRNGCFVPIFL